MLRNITNDELTKILKDHKVWAESDGKEGTQADLSYAKLYGANLRGANLRGANLSCANLFNADLRGADLSGAKLEGANLYGACLSGANLRDANLRGANLRDANLVATNLSYANLYGANLDGAYLEGADLYGAIVTAPWRIVDGKLLCDDAEAAQPSKADVFDNQFVVFDQLCALLDRLQPDQRSAAIEAIRSKYAST